MLDDPDNEITTEGVEEDDDGNDIAVDYVETVSTCLVIAARDGERLRVEVEDTDEPGCVLFLDKPAGALLEERAPRRASQGWLFDADADMPYLDLVERFATADLDAGQFAPEPTWTGSELPWVVNLFDLMETPAGPREWLEFGIIEAGHVNKLTAASGVGKTLLLAQMAVSWSLGMSALDVAGSKPRRLDRAQRVLYIDGELGTPWWRRYLGKFGFPVPYVRRNFHLRTLSTATASWPPPSTHRRGHSVLREH